MEALVDEASLSSTTIHHLFRVEADESVEKGIKLVIWVVFCSHYSAHSLHFLPSWLEMHANLDGHVGTGQIDGRVTNTTEEDDIDLVGCLEQFVYFESLVTTHLAMDQSILQFLSIVFQNVWPITKYQYFITSWLVNSEQILENPKLNRIGRMNQLPPIQQTILICKFLSHFAAYFNTVWFGKATLTHQILPILFK